MDTLTEWTLGYLVVYGTPILILIAFVGSLGIPFPISIVIVAAGAFAREGLLDWRLGLVASLVGASSADNSEFLLGRLAQPWLRRRFGQGKAWQQAQSTLDRQGGWAILLTRFWFTPLAPAINMMAGSRYPFLRFLALDLFGQFIWVILYGGLGYLFASQWKWIGQALGKFSTLSVIAFLAAAGLVIVLRRKKVHK